MPEAQRLPRLAEHAERAGQKALSASLHLRLAQGAQKRHAYLEAELGYSRAFELTDPGATEQRLATVRGRGLMRYRVGRFADALLDFQQAQALAEALGDGDALVTLMLEEATALDWMNEYSRSRELLERARSLSASAPSALLEAELAMCTGRSLVRFGEYAQAVGVLGQAVTLATPLGDEAYETRVVALLLKAPVEAVLGQLTEAEADFEQVLSLCVQRGDQLHWGSAVQNRALLHMARRDPQGALDDSVEFLKVSRQMGLLNSEFRGEYNLAELLYQLGNAHEAIAHCERAEVLAGRLMGKLKRPDGLLLRARLHLYLGEIDEARALIEKVRAGQAEARAQGQSQSLLLPAEEVLCQMVELGVRPAFFAEEWECVVAEATRLAVQSDPIEVMEMRGLAAARAGRKDKARELLKQALATAAGIPNLFEKRIRQALAAL